MDKQLDILSKIPKEHYTEHFGKSILVKDLIKLLSNEENTNNGTAGRGKDDTCQTSHTDVGGCSLKRRRDKKRDS